MPQPVPALPSPALMQGLPHMLVRRQWLLLHPPGTAAVQVQLCSGGDANGDVVGVGGGELLAVDTVVDITTFRPLQRCGTPTAPTTARGPHPDRLCVTWATLLPPQSSMGPMSAADYDAIAALAAVACCWCWCLRYAEDSDELLGHTFFTVKALLLDPQTGT